MPKIILRCNFLKDEPPEHLANYVKYIGTREGVEKVDPGKARLPATVKQKQLIEQIIKDIDGVKRMHEYDDYILNPTRENASEFISIALENNLDLIAKRKNYVDYIANRPRVGRINEHGLFTDEETPVVLAQVAEEVANHKGVIWTHVISLRREDAERLGYNSAEQWMSLIRKKKDMLCVNMRIDSANLKWYAAFHNESHHPHVHLFVYSEDEKEGFLTNDGIESMRSSLAHTVFRQDFMQIYDRQNEARGMLKENAETVMERMIRQIQTGVCENRAIEEKILTLAERLKNITGKKVYGYLNADVKSIVDQIVDELEKDGRVAQLYSKWNDAQNEILKTYTDTLPPPLPLSRQPAFKGIKNMVITEAVNIGEHRFTFESDEEPEETENFPGPVENTVETVEDFIPDEDEQSPPDELPVDSSQDLGLTESPQVAGYRVEWNDRYKKAREYLYGSGDVDQDFKKAYQLFSDEAESGNALALYDIGRMHHDGLGKEISEEIAQQWYARALSVFKEVEAIKPKPYVQYRIGKMYAAGQGTAQDYAEAAGWFQEAVAKNHKYAQYSLAGLYYFGNGVEQDYATAYSLYSRSAAQGNPYADYELAKMLRDGIGTEINSKKAAEHFKKAFDGFVILEQESRDDKLQYRIGQMLYTGIGTKKDVGAALKYFELSAKLGNVNAQYMLGKIYLDSGSAEDVRKALEWLGMASENGNAIAQYALGKLYRDGNHVEKDMEKAVELFTISAEQKNHYATYALGKIYLEGKGLPTDISLAVKWFAYSSDLGNQFAQYALGKLYRDDIHVNKDMEKAVELFTKSAEQKNQYAAYALGKLFLEGKEISRDVPLAVRWLTVSSGQGNQFAQYALAKLYLTGEDIEQDIPKAVELLTKSALQKNQFAAYELGRLYLVGDKVAKDIPLAVRWLTVSAEQENQYAAYQLGKLYLSGEDIPKDVAAALRWLTLSADKGNQYAQYALGKLYLTGNDVQQDKETAMKWLTASASQGNVYAQFLIDHIDSFGEPSVLLAATRLMHHLGNIFREDQHRYPAGHIAHIDRKRMRQLMEKKRAQGHAAGDYEQQPVLNAR
jgi:TPR repeat protein